MKNLWDPEAVAQFEENTLQLRVYTSRLLGQNSDLVLHGGGNTSVKIQQTNLFGEAEDILYVKGSGCDLATIDEDGFTPLLLKTLRKLAALENISDVEMIRQQQMAKSNPDAPNPSVEALLHAIIPFNWIDHTHADAVVTLTNTPEGNELIRKIYGERLLLIPYVMPGFKLSRKVFEMTTKIDWTQFEGMILLNHGIFSFGDTALESYTRMIDLVSLAEDFLAKNSTLTNTAATESVPGKAELLKLACIRRKVSAIRGTGSLAQLNFSKEARTFAKLTNVKEIATRGPITSDHLIRTKSVPAIIDPENPQRSLDEFSSAYKAYFERHTNGEQKCLDSAPRWAVWPGHGTISFGANLTESGIVSDIAEHTVKAIQLAENLTSEGSSGRWQPVSEKHLFEAEYWVLQQAKLKSENVNHGVQKTISEFQGKIAIVSGAASGIGLACARELFAQGAVVVGLDLNPEISKIFCEPGMLGLQCDVTDQKAVIEAVAETVRQFGGIDILVLNAGTFPAGQTIEEMGEQTWSRSLEINLTAPQQLLQACVPFLKEGLDPAVVFMASRNVPAPGAGASAYSVPKAGQTQLARIAALELGKFGIRVNILHPDCVYDTGLWTPDALERSAKRYGLTVEQYKSRNILKIDVKTKEVARMVCAMSGAVFAKTTGAQIPIDGGSERVI
ncbi:MAG: bifunctional aldolase/short-chain dehydrogenase [SAR324 cluster bacterium]|nr:bifunctional aldolase/short-chain dehydrogenase [SAR324 cluster bacterium]MDP7047759.1 bifunctional aldolase/short-chain dehydrogenase [SAR324 cluster bacterium]